jgi:HEAT repeat protein
MRRYLPTDPLSLWERVRVRAGRPIRNTVFDTLDAQPSPPAPLPKGEGRHAAGLSHILFGLLLAIGSVSAAAAADAVLFSKLLDDLLPGMGAANIADREQPQQKFQDICLSLGTPGREAQRAEACKLIATKLGPDGAKPARLWLLKQLRLIGRAECVDAVAALLGDADADIRTAARAALACNPAPEANARLVASLSAAGDAATRAALIHSLGYRRNPANVEVLAKQLLDSDKSVIAAAAEALGPIGDANLAIILSAAKPSSEKLARAAADLRLNIAQRMVREGKAAEATETYRELNVPSQPRAVRLAAKAGLLRAAGSRAPTMALQWLESDDSDSQAAAAGYIGEVGDPAALAQLAADLPKLPAASQITLLSVLVAKGDKSAMAAARLAAKSDDPGVQAAGLAAVGRLGDTSVVPRLIELATSDSPAAIRASDGLQQVKGPDVDEAIIAAMERAAGLAAKKPLIAVLEARGALAAVPSLVKLAQQSDPALRAEAVRALGRLATEHDLPALVEVAAKTAKGRERNEVEKTIVLVSNMDNAVAQGVPVLALYAGASKPQRLILLPVLGRIGGPNALQRIKEAMASADAELVDAGVCGLCNWPDPGVANELLEIAGHSANQDHRVRAIRAYVRVITTPAAQPDAKTLGELGKTMQMATRDEDKRLIVGRAAAVRSVETLRWVLPYLDDKSLAGEASKTIVDLARRKELFTPNRDEFIKALRKVVEVGSDRAVVERAEQIIQGK